MSAPSEHKCAWQSRNFGGRVPQLDLQCLQYLTHPAGFENFLDLFQTADDEHSSFDAVGTRQS